MKTLRKSRADLNRLHKLDDNHRAWIFTKGGKIKSGILAINTCDFIDELVPYEIEFDDEFLDFILENGNPNNSYNWSSPISNDFEFTTLKYDGYFYVAISFHRSGDVRGNYTNYSILRFDDECDFFELGRDYSVHYKDYTIDICVWHEGGEIYNGTWDYIDTTYELEIKDIDFEKYEKD